MALETASHIHQLIPANPSGADRASTADDHLRLLKRVMVQDLGSLQGPLEVTAAFLNSLKTALTPVGSIMAWGLAASAIPVGWAICDGREVPLTDGTGKITTPDLRGRVLAGATEARPAGTPFGQESRTATTSAAGSHRHTATVSEAGGHSHTVTGGTIGSAKTGVTVSATSDNVDDGGSAKNMAKLPIVVNDPGHTHDFSGIQMDSAGSHTHQASMSDEGSHGHSVTLEVTQPTISILWIMRI